jgi:hypothetical protein
MSFDCSFCNFTAPTRARYMRHLGTQKHGRNYLEGTKHLIKDKTKKEAIQEVVQENEISEECVQEEESEETLEFTGNYFLDTETIRLFNNMSQTIELSPVFIWIITLLNRFKNILPQNSTLEPNNDDSSENIFLGR